MWPKIVAGMRAYRSAVLTAVDDSGYPYSLRCQPQAVDAEQVLELDIPDNTAIQTGKASLLWHKHDDDVGAQTSFLVRGTLERQGARWRLRPEQLTPGMVTNPVEMVSLLIACRRRAANYLKKRNLPRPQVAWDEVKALWAEADAIRQGQR